MTAIGDLYPPVPRDLPEPFDVEPFVERLAHSRTFFAEAAGDPETAEAMLGAPVDVLGVRTHSVIVKARNGDCSILDYYRNDEVHSDGPYSLAVAKFLRPGAELRAVSGSPRASCGLPTEDMLDRAGGY